MGVCRIEIPFKLPSCNTYIYECRRNKFAGATLKKKIEKEIIKYLDKMPIYKNPIKIKFLWIEENKRRDLDRSLFCKKVYSGCYGKSRQVKR